MTRVAGLPVTGLVDTSIDLAEVRSPQALVVDDLVVVADAVLMALTERIVISRGRRSGRQCCVTRWPVMPVVDRGRTGAVTSLKRCPAAPGLEVPADCVTHSVSPGSE